MAYPETPKFGYPCVIQTDFKTIVSEFAGGNEQRRRLLRFPKRVVSLTYKNISQADRNIISNYFRTYYGAYGNSTGGLFYFFDQAQRAWQDEYVGRGDTGQVAFEIHSRLTSTDTIVMYIAGTSTGGAITATSTTGTEGATVVTLTTAPATGALITCDFTGYLRAKVRFAEDGFREEINLARSGTQARYNVVINLQEVQW